MAPIPGSDNFFLSKKGSQVPIFRRAVMVPPSISFSRRLFILFLIFLFRSSKNVIITTTTTVFAQSQQQQYESDDTTSFTSNPKIPIHTIQKAIRFIQQNPKHNEQQKKDLQQDLIDGNIDIIYRIAKTMNLSAKNDNKEENKITSMEIFHALADNNNGQDGHILSQVALGFAYSENDKLQAIKYFVLAGENDNGPPHQAALYNAGRLLADPDVEDYVKALAYLRAAYTVSKTNPEYARDHLTETSRYAYERLSEQLIALLQESTRTKGDLLDIQQIADMFLYANIENFPLPSSKEEKIWENAMHSFQKQQWEVAFVQFEKFEKVSGLSNLQLAFLEVLKQYTKSASNINRGGKGEL